MYLPSCHNKFHKIILIDKHFRVNTKGYKSRSGFINPINSSDIFVRKHNNVFV